MPSTTGGPFSICFGVHYEPTRLHSYVEKQLETDVSCDDCSLEFAVAAFDAYGKVLWARMPAGISGRARGNLFWDLEALD